LSVTPCSLIALSCSDSPARLRAPEPVYAQGVALVSELVCNGDSPLYAPGGELGVAIEATARALDGDVA